MPRKKETLELLKLKLKRTELLLEINSQVAELNDLTQILWKIIQFLTEELKAERGTLFLNDDETNELYSRIAQGALTREIRILNNVGIAGAIFQSQKGEIIHDVYKDSRFNEEVDQETSYKTKNMICCPVKTIGGKTIGVIEVLNKKRGRFTKDNLIFSEAAATRAAKSIQNAKEYAFQSVLLEMSSRFD